MPIVPPALDDRRFDDLVEELLARIPAHTPEWTNPRPGDPGRTLIELFAWLGEALLYRANLVPERQRLAFLRLLGAPMRPALPARGLVTVSFADDSAARAAYLRPLARIDGPRPFESLGELTVLPVTAEAYYKRRLSASEQGRLESVVTSLQQVYNLPRRPTAYVTTPAFPGGAADPAGLDLGRAALDSCLWLALLAPKAELTGDARAALGANPSGGRQLINVGVMPALAVPALSEEVGRAAGLPHVWEISTPTEGLYISCDQVADSSAGLTRRGVLRLALPGAGKIGAPDNDVRRALSAGVGDRPPRLDDPKKAARLVAWLRLRPTAAVSTFALSWAGINAVEIDQRQTVAGRVVGVSDGSADQRFQLPGTSVDPDSLRVEVEEAGRGYVPWGRTDDLLTAGRDDRVYALDGEAGAISFGDGVRGLLPAADARVRVALMRAGGGEAGNLAPGQLTRISAVGPDGQPVAAVLRAGQPLPTEGGRDAESLAEAERRIPALFRHRERAVTEDDYRRLAAEAPGVRVGRVEVLPRFKPQQRRERVPGVVSVMVLPHRELSDPPYPRADRLLIEAVYGHLEARRPLTSELYVIGCEYVPIALTVGVTVGDGPAQPGSGGALALPGGAAAARDAVLREVRDSLRRYLWPLGGGGPAGGGWPLGRAVGERELEVVVARVAGVSGVVGVRIFTQGPTGWAEARGGAGQSLVPLEPYQLPELMAVLVVANAAPPADPQAPPPRGLPDLAVPVVPDVC